MNTQTVFNQIRTPLTRLACLGLLLLGGHAASAQAYTVFLDTSGLNPNDSYAVDLQLNQGDPNNASSAVNVSNFLFGGGGSAGGANTIYTSGSGTSGSFGSGVTLITSAASPYNDFSQNFNNGNSVSLNVNASALRVPTGAAPDEFIFDLYDNTAGAPVATTDASSNSSPAGFELFTLTRSAQGYTPLTYGYTGINGFHQAQATPNASPAPEPASWATLGMVCFGLGGMLLRARKRVPQGR